MLPNVPFTLTASMVESAYITSQLGNWHAGIDAINLLDNTIHDTTTCSFRCSEGFTGQRCQFKKAMKFQSPVIKGFCSTKFVDTIFINCSRLRCLRL